MCFSPEMDLATGVVVGALAVDAARNVTHRSQWPIAALPAVFAVHQLVEAFVWWGAEGKTPEWVGDAATLAYLVIAFTVVPVLVPVAVRAVEPEHRRRLLALPVALGVVAAVSLGWSLATSTFTARVAGHHIAYDGRVLAAGVTVSVYVLATCGAMLLSGHQAIRWYGVVNAPVIALLVWLDQTALTSLWCVWAALTSVLVVVYLRTAAPTRLSPGEPLARGTRQRG